jgi:hypothetical protein
MDTNNLLELYRQLRDGSAVDAWNLVEKIRSGEAPIDVPRRLDAAQGSICKPSPRPTGLVEALDPAINRYSRKTSLPAMGSPQGTSSKSHVTKRYAVSQTNSPKANGRGAATEAHRPAVHQKIEEHLPYEMSSQAETSDAIHGEEDCDVVLQRSLRENMNNIQEGFYMQQSCISEIFLCHSKETFETLMSYLKQDCADPPTRSLLCEICAVATIAGQYVQDSLRPGVLDQWYSRPGFQTIVSANSSRADMS